MRRYAENYSRIAQDDLVEDLMSPELKKAQARKAVAYVGDCGRVLDVGVGKGVLLHELSGQKVGVDIAMEYLRFSRNEAHLAASVAESQPFRDKAFDTVFLTDILEHVIDPGIVLQEAKRVLVPGGKLLVRVPDREDIRKYGEGKYDFAHLRSFNKKSLCYLLTRSGFEIIRVEYDSFVIYRPSRFTKAVRSVLSPSRVFLRRFKPSSVSMCALLYLTSAYRASDMRPALANLPNWVGRLLCDPVEIAVVCRRAA